MIKQPQNDDKSDKEIVQPNFEARRFQKDGDRQKNQGRLQRTQFGHDRRPDELFCKRNRSHGADSRHRDQNWKAISSVI